MYAIRSYYGFVFAFVVLQVSFMRAQEKQFTSLEELPSSFAFSVFKDSYGFVWIGGNGIVKYDASEMILFDDDKENPNQYLGGDTKVIFEDSKRRLWTGTSKGITRYLREEDRFVYYDSTKTYKKWNVLYDASSFLEDHTGTLWVGTAHGIFKYLPEDDVFLGINAADVSEKNIGAITAMYLDSENNFWLGTKDRGLFRFDVATKSIFPYEEAWFKRDADGRFAAIADITEDKKGNLWVRITSYNVCYTKLLRNLGYFHFHNLKKWYM